MDEPTSQNCKSIEMKAYFCDDAHNRVGDKSGREVFSIIRENIDTSSVSIPSWNSIEDEIMKTGNTFIGHASDGVELWLSGAYIARLDDGELIVDMAVEIRGVSSFALAEHAVAQWRCIWDVEPGNLPEEVARRAMEASYCGNIGAFSMELWGHATDACRFK